MALDPMEALKSRFRLRCGDDLQLLTDMRKDRQRGLAEEFKIRVHRIAGIAGALGYDALGERAKTIDDALSHDVALADHHLDRLQAELQTVASVS